MNIERQYTLSGRVFESDKGISLSIDDFFQFAHKHHCASVELRHSQINPWSTQAEINRIKNLSEKYSLPIEMITMRKGKLNSDSDLELFLSYLDIGTKLNCRQIKISGKGILQIQYAASLAEEQGITIGINNHVGTALETRQGTMEFFSLIKHTNMKLLFDPSHLWLNKDSADEDFIKAISNIISYVVVQDYVETTREDAITIAYRTVKATNANEKGAVGYPQIMSILDKLNCHVPYGLVQPGALFYLNNMEKR